MTLQITAEVPTLYHSTSGSSLVKQFFHVQGSQLKTRDICTFRLNDYHALFVASSRTEYSEAQQKIDCLHPSAPVFHHRPVQ